MKSATLIVLLACLVSGCSVERVPLVATDVIISKPLPGMTMSAGYLTLTNNTTQAIKITRVSSPEFDSVAMHESVLEDGMARMYALGDLMILPGQTVEFVRGGKHLMLMRPHDDIETVTLEFYAGKAMILSVNTTFKD
jgi:copper(I)-binding protein